MIWLVAGPVVVDAWWAAAHLVLYLKKNKRANKNIFLKKIIGSKCNKFKVCHLKKIKNLLVWK